jgi:oligopeptide transport system substrate-binding protein
MKAGSDVQTRKRLPFERLTVLCFVSLFTIISSCTPSTKSKSDALFSDGAAPKRQELRWSNGKLPKTFDPAFATSPPDIDVVRSIYEGLTDLDSRTLQEVPAAAEKWDTPDGGRTWTFQLRKDLKWSNGEPLLAQDFVRSWMRAGNVVEDSAIRGLLTNIVGMPAKSSSVALPNVEAPKLPGTDAPPTVIRRPSQPVESVTPRPAIEVGGDDTSGARKDKNDRKFGVEAISASVLRVSLVTPDMDFPRLVAHPVFRPVFGTGDQLLKNGLDPGVVTNGPFRISSVDVNGVVVARSDSYWDASKISLDLVRFVPSQSAEKALLAYTSGDVDIITNADLEPLALKLLSPYSDFRQATNNALNLYEFNVNRAPYNDKRVREALAIAIERDRLTEGEMKGATEPAYHFLPYDSELSEKWTQNIDKAKKLLETSGFHAGENFPLIRLVVNRNETQLRIARSVARMWKQNLNLETELVIKENTEMEPTRTGGDFDIIRRGVVFPTLDRSVSLAALFPQGQEIESENAHDILEPPNPQLNSSVNAETGSQHPADLVIGSSADELDNRTAYDFRLIPLYFPVSYGLVKPYVQGFDINGLDAPSLKNVRINSDWQPSPLTN